MTVHALQYCNSMTLLAFHILNMALFTNLRRTVQEGLSMEVQSDQSLEIQLFFPSSLPPLKLTDVLHLTLTPFITHCPP